MRRGPLICDTGALLDYFDARAPDYPAFRSALDAAPVRYVPGLVLGEVDYFLRRRRAVMRMFMQNLARGMFVYVPADARLLERAMAVDERFADLELGLVDATIVALADELGVYRLATRDVRHFSAVRTALGRAFELVVKPRS